MEHSRVTSVILLCIVFSLFNVYLTEDAEPLSELCQMCICEATSKCNKSMKCEDNLCGMYKFSRSYWEDAGSLEPLESFRDFRMGPYVESNLTEFETCAFNPSCAEATVQNYMIKYAQDCNNDGNIDCLDYAAIHHKGAFGCRGTLDEDYKQKISECLRAAEILRHPKKDTNV